MTNAHGGYLHPTRLPALVVVWVHGPWDWFPEAGVLSAPCTWCPLRDACVTVSHFHSLAWTCYWLSYRVGTQHWQGVSHYKGSHPMEHLGNLQLPADVSNMVPCHRLRNKRDWKTICNFVGVTQACCPGWYPQLERRKSHMGTVLSDKLTITVWEQKAATALHKLARDCNLLNYGWSGRLRLV